MLIFHVNCYRTGTKTGVKLQIQHKTHQFLMAQYEEISKHILKMRISKYMFLFFDEKFVFAVFFHTFLTLFAAVVKLSYLFLYK